MSFIMGLKRASAVYLVADSAITKAQQRDSVSSFGESTRHSGTLSAQEGVLKLKDFGTCAVAFAGDLRVAASVIQVMDGELSRGAAPREAFRSGIRNNWPSCAHVCLLVAVSESPAPGLLSYDGSSGAMEPRDHADGDAVSFGSLPQAYSDLARHMGEMALAMGEEPSLHLAAMLGCLQMLTVRDPILANGVGGAFCGLFAACDRLIWQKDIVWLVVEKLTAEAKLDWVVSFCRDGALFVRSSISDSFRALGGPCPSAAAQEQIRRCRRQPVQFFMAAAVSGPPDDSLGFGVVLNPSLDMVHVIPLREDAGCHMRVDVSLDDRGLPLMTFHLNNSLQTATDDWRTAISSGGPLRRMPAICYHVSPDHPLAKALGIPSEGSGK
jgi:hypothetical protein